MLFQILSPVEGEAACSQNYEIARILAPDLGRVKEAAKTLARVSEKLPVYRKTGLLEGSMLVLLGYCSVYQRTIN